MKQMNPLKKANLNPALLRLGFRFYFKDLGQTLNSAGDIEETILIASSRIEESPLLGSLLATWVTIHGNIVRIEKLKKMSLDFFSRDTISEEEKIGAFWLTVIAHLAVSKGFHKWRGLASALLSLAIENHPDIWKDIAQIAGNAPWLEGSGLYIPEKKSQGKRRRCGHN